MLREKVMDYEKGGHFYLLRFKICFLCLMEVVYTQTSSHIVAFQVLNNTVQQGASIKCKAGTSINIVDTYGSTESGFVSVSNNDYSRIHVSCVCMQTCTLPNLEFKGNNVLNFYVKYNCLKGTCPATTDSISSTLSPTTTTVDTQATKRSSTAVPSTSKTRSSTIQEETHKQFSFKVNGSTTATEETDKDSFERNKLHNGGNKETNMNSVITIVVASVVFLLGIAGCLTGFAFYRRRKKSSGRKGEGHMTFHAHSKTGDTDLTNNERIRCPLADIYTENNEYDYITVTDEVNEAQDHYNENGGRETANSDGKEQLAFCVTCTMADSTKDSALKMNDDDPNTGEDTVNVDDETMNMGGDTINIPDDDTYLKPV